MTADKFWTFPQIAAIAAQDKKGKYWRSYTDDYLGVVVGDFWRGRFGRVFHRPLGFANRTPDIITRQIVWRMLGVAKPPAFHGVRENEHPDWAALAKVPPEDYGVGCSPPGIRNTFLVQLLLPEAEARDWIHKQGKPKSARGRPTEWNWDGAVGHLIAVANTMDGLPDTQADIERLVADWFSDTYDAQPAESAIRKHVCTWCKEVLTRPQNN